MRPTRRVVASVLGVASIGLAGCGLAAPNAVGNAVGISPGVARALGWRDLGLGLGLVVRGGPGFLVARAVADLGDAALFGRRRPLLGVTAVASAATALAAARA